MHKKIYILFLSLILIVSCDKTHLSLRSIEKRLTMTEWKVDSYVDHTLNVCHEPLNTKYIFRESGEFTVIKADTLLYNTTWSLDDKKEYLQIGNNTFKLVLVTNKILSLRYGDIDIYYVPAE